MLCSLGLQRLGLVSTSYVSFTELQSSNLTKKIYSLKIHRFLADRTNGRDIGTVLRPSVVCTECIVAKQCVLEQKLLLRAYVVYEKSIGTKMNDLRLGHINHCVTFDVEYLGKK